MSKQTIDYKKQISNTIQNSEITDFHSMSIIRNHSVIKFVMLFQSEVENDLFRDSVPYERFVFLRVTKRVDTHETRVPVTNTTSTRRRDTRVLF